jgi:hypothetical protein
MSFAIRQTFKPRVLPGQLDSTDPMAQNAAYDPEEAQQIITAIKQFNQRSSHENLLVGNDLKEILRNSSINPDTNPLAREMVEEMVRAKEAKHGKINNPTVRAPVDTFGFSNSSVDQFASSKRSAAMEAELKRELDEIRAKRREERGGPDDEDFDTSDLPEEVVKQIAAMRGGSPLDEDDEDADEDADEKKASDPAASSSKVVRGEAEKARQESTRARRVLAYGYPARASMVRGFTPRTGGSGGAGIKKTAMGMADSF